IKRHLFPVSAGPTREPADDSHSSNDRREDRNRPRSFVGERDRADGEAYPKHTNQVEASPLRTESPVPAGRSTTAKFVFICAAPVRVAQGAVIAMACPVPLDAR